MQFEKDVDFPEHTHEAQWGVVLSGEINLIIDGKGYTFKKGDNYYIPKDIRHSGHIKVGYSDITYFNQKDRYSNR
jgi:quercetin dioxygenase-like cupin family protein